MKTHKLIALVGLLSITLFGCASNNASTPNQEAQKQNCDDQLGVGQFGNQEDSEQSLLERGEV